MAFISGTSLILMPLGVVNIFDRPAFNSNCTSLCYETDRRAHNFSEPCQLSFLHACHSDHKKCGVHEDLYKKEFRMSQ
jgi:hypothetical protein